VCRRGRKRSRDNDHLLGAASPLPRPELRWSLPRCPRRRWRDQPHGRIGYTTKKNKIETRTPGGFDYWLTLTANGSAQRFTVTQFTNETSSPFLLIPGSSGYTAACAGVSISTSQVGGAVTFVVPAAPQGTTSYVELRFSTGNPIGEASPKSSSTVEYLFITGGIPGSTRELKLAKISS
jgi:hypothetical protein